MDFTLFNLILWTYIHYYIHILNKKMKAGVVANLDAVQKTSGGTPWISFQMPCRTFG